MSCKAINCYAKKARLIHTQGATALKSLDWYRSVCSWYFNNSFGWPSAGAQLIVSHDYWIINGFRRKSPLDSHKFPDFFQRSHSHHPERRQKGHRTAEMLMTNLYCETTRCGQTKRDEIFTFYHLSHLKSPNEKCNDLRWGLWRNVSRHEINCAANRIYQYSSLVSSAAES